MPNSIGTAPTLPLITTGCDPKSSGTSTQLNSCCATWPPGSRPRIKPVPVSMMPEVSSSFEPEPLGIGPPKGLDGRTLVQTGRPLDVTCPDALDCGWKSNWSTTWKVVKSWLVSTTASAAAALVGAWLVG